jgi:uncharacterized protein GlcG (DUF336 family)
MKTDEAKQVLEAARAKAAAMGKAVSVAIVDSAGVMVVFERLNNAPRMTAVIAEGKASASALTGRASGALAAMAQNYPHIAGSLATRLQGRFVPVAGGLPIVRDGEVLGAIGVSGASAEEDEEIAQAGAGALAAG